MKGKESQFLATVNLIVFEFCKGPPEDEEDSEIGTVFSLCVGLGLFFLLLVRSELGEGRRLLCFVEDAGLV